MTKPKTGQSRRSARRTGLSKRMRIYKLDAGPAQHESGGVLSFQATEKPGTVRIYKRSKALLRHFYDEAAAISREVGTVVSFRVDVDPEGATTVTHLMESEGFPVEEIDKRAPALEEALAGARERGHSRVSEILSGQDMLSADKFAELLGTTRMTVNTKRQKKQLLALDGTRRGYRFPRWQVGADGKPYGEIPALLDHLGAAWAVDRLLVQPQGALGGLTGREALERGRGPDVVAAAEGLARGDFT